MFKFLKSDWMRDHFSSYKLYRKLHGGSWKEHILLDTGFALVTVWVEGGEEELAASLIKTFPVLKEEVYD